MKRAIVITCSIVAALLAGCSSDGDILPKKERFTPALLDAGGVKDGGAQDATPDALPDIAGDGKMPRDPNANCVKPGTPNNERGVGGYCEPHAGFCESDQGLRFCTADYGELTTVPDDQWFCSTVCSSSDECGSGAVCVASDLASGCVPIVCRKDGGFPVSQDSGR